MSDTTASNAASSAASASQRTVHLFVFDGFADWEAAYAIAGINQPDFQREPGSWRVQTVSIGSGLVRSLGGLPVLPDARLAGLMPENSAMLILPGGAGWDEGQHLAGARKALDFLAAGVPVAAICGATAGLARVGALNERRHTSNALAYLHGVKNEGYAGSDRYEDAPAVVDGPLITAAGMAPLEFARAIFATLGIYADDALEAWYQLYRTGRSEYFSRLQAAGAVAAGATAAA